MDRYHAVAKKQELPREKFRLREEIFREIEILAKDIQKSEPAAELEMDQAEYYDHIDRGRVNQISRDHDDGRIHDLLRHVDVNEYEWRLLQCSNTTCLSLEKSEEKGAELLTA